MPAWHRDQWIRTIWESRTLTGNPFLVAYTYAQYAGKGDIAWCPGDELARCTGIRSKSSRIAALRAVVDAGWLTLVEPARQHRAARYRLTYPAALRGPDTRPLGIVQGSENRTAEDVQGSGFQTQGSGNRTAQGSEFQTRSVVIPLERREKGTRMRDPHDPHGVVRDALHDRGAGPHAEALTAEQCERAWIRYGANRVDVLAGIRHDPRSTDDLLLSLIAEPHQTATGTAGGPLTADRVIRQR